MPLGPGILRSAAVLYAVLQEGLEKWCSEGRNTCDKNLCNIDIADPLKNDFLESYRTWWH